MRNVCRALALISILAVLSAAQTARKSTKTSKPASKSTAAASTGVTAEARDRAAAELVHLLMPKSHADQMMAQIGQQFMFAAAADYKRRGLTIPPDFEGKMKSALEGSVSYDEITKWGANVYSAHFTLSELRQLIAFYTSPLGHKLLQDQPEIGQQSMRQVLMAVDHRLPPAMKREGLEPPVPRSQQGAQTPAPQAAPQTPAPSSEQSPKPDTSTAPPK